MVPPATARYDWILALTTIAFVCSAFGNGANDVANSYATSVAARTLTMPQVGFLSAITEFVGAVGLGSRVTSTIKNGIISISRFEGRPGALMLAMGCAEVGSACWLLVATGLGFPVSTTQTVVGALIGVGFASQAPIKWAWSSGSVSQVAASWGVAPAVAAGFSALLFATLKYSILERADSFKWAMHLIPFYMAFTAAILALFIVVEAPTAPSLEEFGAGKAVGIILGVFFGVLLVAYVFFKPYFWRRLVKQDSRVKFYHVPLGPLLRKDNPPLYFPAKSNNYVIDYYADPYQASETGHSESDADAKSVKKRRSSLDAQLPSTGLPAQEPTTMEKGGINVPIAPSISTPVRRSTPPPGPRQRFLDPVAHLSITHPKRLYGYLQFVLLQGVTRDCVTHSSLQLASVHARAKRYDVRVEHLWTYCQVASAMLMSIAHGSNDVANAVGPWAATYQTYRAGVVATESDTPVWFLVVAGLLLGLGFWVYGFHIIRALGNKITRMSSSPSFLSTFHSSLPPSLS